MATHSRRAAAVPSGGSALRWGGLAAAALVTGAIWWWAGPKPEAPQPSENALAEARKVKPALPAPAPAPAQAEPYIRRWDFNTPEQAKDFQLITGSWHHVPDGGPDGKGCMETETELFAAIPNVPVQPSCVVAGFKAANVGVYKMSSAGVVWDATSDFVQLRNVGPIIRVPPNHWCEHLSYLTDQHIDSWVLGSRSTLVFAARQPQARLVLELRGRKRLDDLEIRTGTLGEIPSVNEYRAAIEELPPERRVGAVELPRLKSMRPPKPVLAIFLKDDRNAEGEQP